MSRKEDVPDVPRVANAAQMASRNIKNAKSGRRPRPIQSNSAPQSMSFGGGDGGLFGGSIQGSSSFEFAAPDAPTIQFPSSPFGGSVMAGPFGAARKETEKNYVDRSAPSPFSDGNYEEDLRRKKPFQSTSSSSNNPAPFSSGAPAQSNIFGGQQSFGFNSMNGQQPSNSFTFQSSSQPASPGLGAFNSAPTQSNPVSNMFTFSAPTSRPASPSPSIAFGSGPSQDTSTSNMFNFSQPQAKPAQASSSIFRFGSAPPAATQNQPTNNPFAPKETTTQPSSAAFFPSAPVTQAPPSNFFGNTQNSSTSSINFGSTPATAAPTTNMFGTPSKPLSGTAPQQSAPTPATGSNNLDQITHAPAENQENTQPTSNAPATNILGTSPSKPLFGSGLQQSAPTPNPFSQLNTPAPPTNNFFGSQPEPQSAATPNNMFGGYTTRSLSANESPAPFASTLYSNPNKPAESPAPFTSSLFSNLNKPAGAPAPSTTSIFSNLNQSTQPTSNVFGNQNSPATSNMFATKTTTTTSDLFGNLNKPIEQAAPQVNGTPVNGTAQSTKRSESSTSSLFNKAPSTNISGGSSTFSAPTSQTETPIGKSTPNLLFGSSQPPASATQANGTSQQMKPIDAPSSASQPPPSGMFPNLPTSSAKSQGTSNKSVGSAAVNTIIDERTSSANALVNGNGTTEVHLDSLYPEMAAAGSFTDEYLSSLAPIELTTETQKNAFYAAFRLGSLNKALQFYLATIPFSTCLGDLFAYYNEKKIEILDRSSIPVPGPKRRFTVDEEQENQNPSKRARQVGPPKSSIFPPSPANKPQTSDELEEDQENEHPSKRTRPDAASTSNIFQAAQPQKQTAKSPEKSQSADHQQPYLNGSTPKAPSYVPGPSFAPSMTSSNSASVATPATKGKRKAEVQLTKDDHEREEQEGRRMKTPKINGDTNGSNTSNIFKGILGSPGKKVGPPSGASPAKIAAPNPFGGLSVPKSPERDPHRSNAIEQAGGQSHPNGSDVLEEAATRKEAPTPVQNMFAPKPAATSTPPHSGPPKFGPPQSGPPKFGGPGAGVDFFTQFKAKAKANEDALMAKDMEEDLDSDEDEETKQNWKAEWIAKRKAKLEELEKIGKSGTGFVPIQKEASTSSPNIFFPKPALAAPAVSNMFAAKEASTSSTNIFAPKPAHSTTNSPFSSRTSTPGPFGSNTGSVFDGHTPGKAPIIEAGNIFGHLAQKPSEVESGQADEDTESEGGEDSENKDPNYVPGNDESSSGPGTPVEETGAGIASAKKATASGLFGASSWGGVSGTGSPLGTSSPSRSIFDQVTAGAPASGTSTPSGRLKDRITHVPVPTENKENKQPTTDGNNLFASLNKALASPADQTWKPDTPIKFGSASSTATNSVFPAVNVTEATPPKVTTNLFGNAGTSSTLFGNSTPKANSSPFLTGASATLGFNFGSPAASLLPSAAASTTTSRATSPGNTTDGVSGDEDAEVEKQEQLDLSAGGPGEEDEDVIHEVRSKALQWVPAKDDVPSSWKSMGVGIARVLQHKETKATRVVIRGDPSGKVILNKALLPNIEYKAEKKTIKFVAAGEGGLETWLLQVKTEEMAQELARVLEENK